MGRSTSANLGWMFYRDYFDGYFTGSEAHSFAEKNKQLYAFKHPGYAELTAYKELGSKQGFFSLDLTTTYPGLLIGTGYTHEITEEDAIKIGFYFDHTTGLPTIPGSSVKGLLRSVFPGQDTEKIKKGEEKGKDMNGYILLKRGKLDYLKGLLAKIGVPEPTISDAYIEQLELELFSGVVSDQRLPLIPKGEEMRAEGNVPMSQRFIAHDAVVQRTEAGLLGPDYITPHKSMISEPVPIQLLKVLPGVRYQFTFQYSDSYRLFDSNGLPFEKAATLKKDQLQKLCKELLLDRGAGAKTNVGYGQFEGVSTSRPPVPKVGKIRLAKSTDNTGNEQEIAAVAAPVVAAPPKAFSIDEVPLFPGNKLKAGKSILAQIIEVKGRALVVKLHTDGWDTPLEVPYFHSTKPEKGAWGEVAIKSIAGNPAKGKIKNILLDTNKFKLK